MLRICSHGRGGQGMKAASRIVGTNDVVGRMLRPGFRRYSAYDAPVSL
jgi:hypothetical protein